MMMQKKKKGQYEVNEKGELTEEQKQLIDK